MYLFVYVQYVHIQGLAHRLPQRGQAVALHVQLLEGHEMVDACQLLDFVLPEPQRCQMHATIDAFDHLQVERWPFSWSNQQICEHILLIYIHTYIHTHISTVHTFNQGLIHTYIHTNTHKRMEQFERIWGIKNKYFQI